ncbi:MAG TPA: OsmC family protein [Minicystis sp.]|nr:OsmC family protein [Minicystis sp.]
MPRVHEPHRFACTTRWTGAAEGATTDYASYSRAYEVHVPGKPVLRGSAAPPFRGDGSLHNPEDLLVAALSACHMLSYLALAARARLSVVAYEDAATGTMDFDGGVMRFTEVMLRPRVTVAAGADVELARALHERAHRECFIASSVAFPVRNEATIELA